MTRIPSAGDGSARWFKSSYSTNEHGSDCVEVALVPGAIHVRDSKDPHGPQLMFTPEAWARFVAFASER
ncbi:DUF397 domain-containing protein [Streptantibioticus ferralitis]|uniref:DUF397 domain-containing protein n=1 Tax=Streptantibioticus ferralitis TaxID=236510 RepID=A0ABT5Z6Y5_9ACTN|nr:DUF397 domain-containing protein [Streptantibioticus ferralitis]MDF2259509.1 DUF397 domain-containing protein [Streptantibioticus ferralitis]